jgi:hypothetical protein
MTIRPFSGFLYLDRVCKTVAAWFVPGGITTHRVPQGEHLPRFLLFGVPPAAFAGIFTGGRTP